MKGNPFNRRRFLSLLAGSVVVSSPGLAAGPEIKMRAVLIWGTNEPKPADAKLKDLDEKTRRKLRAVFKWKDYYEVNRKEFAAQKERGKRVRMSPKCELEVEDLGEATVEVRLFGEGQLVVSKKQIMKPGELLVLAGEDRNDTAWFVALSLAP